jgi:hypothetical protein
LLAVYFFKLDGYKKTIQDVLKGQEKMAKRISALSTQINQSTFLFLFWLKAMFD